MSRGPDRPARLAAVLLALSALAAGCAPRPASVALLDPQALMRRYLARLDAREAQAPGTVAELSLWLETEATGRLPGARATLGLGGADTARLRVDGAFGVALDVAAIGDSLLAWVPSRHAVVRTAADGPPLDFPGASAFCVQAASAAWRAPAGAWAHARSEDSLRILRWTEAGDSLMLGIGGSGLPRSLRRSRPGMGGVRVAYRGYAVEHGVAWPSRLEIADDAGRFHLDVRVRRTGRTPDTAPARFRPALPADAEVVPAGEILKWFEESRK